MDDSKYGMIYVLQVLVEMLYSLLLYIWGMQVTEFPIVTVSHSKYNVP